MIKVGSWLSICSSSTCISTTDDVYTIPPQETGIITNQGATTSCSSSPESSDQDSYSTTTTNSSLDSNLSLLTLPSVPSLQNHLSPENLNTHSLSVVSTSSSSFITSLKSLSPPPLPPRLHRPSLHVNFLAVQDNLLYAVSGHEIVVFDASNNNPFDTFGVQDSSSTTKSSSSSPGSIKSLAFCNGKIFSAHQDSKIRVWKLIAPDKKHKLVATLPTLEDRLRNFMLPKNYVKVRRHRKKLWVEHHDAVSGLAVAENGSTVYSVSWDKYLKVWKAPDFRCVESVKAHDDAINAVVVSSDGLVYTGSADKRIKVWGRPVGDGDDERKRKEKKKKHVLIATLEKHKSAVNALALSSDGTVLFSGSCDRSILVWEREESANHMVLAGALRGHTKAVLCLINAVVVVDGNGNCSPHRDLLFSGSADGTVRVWQRTLMDGRYSCLTVLDGHNKPVKSLVAVPPENAESGGGDVTVLSGSFDGEIKVWKIVVSSSTINKKP